MRRPARRLWSSIVGVIAVAAIVVGINLFADARLANVQLDLTQQRLYTLSAGTKQILQGLKEPVTLRLFYSHQLGSAVPVYGTYADRVREMLQQYATISDGKVRLEFYDPEPFSDTEDRAMAYGLQGVPVDQSGEQVYFGLAGSNLLDDERSIAFFQPERERFLEYDLTKLVYELSNPTRPVIGVMSSLPLDGDPRLMMMRAGGNAGRPWTSIMQLRQTNQVKTVPTDAQVIDPDIQVLLVAQAQDLSDATLYALDQFVMRGGRLMAMVDPYSEAEAASAGVGGMPPRHLNSNLGKLFDAWGIVFDPSKIVGDPSGAWRVRASPSEHVQTVDYVAWFNIRDGISHDDPATADLQQITVASSGFLGKKDRADITFTPLLTSSPASGRDPCRRREDTRPGQGARRVQIGRRPAGHRCARSWRVEIGFRRPAPAAGRPETSRRLSRLQSADGRAGELGRGRGFGHPRRSLLGARTGFLRPARRDAVQRQWRVRQQSASGRSRAATS